MAGYKDIRRKRENRIPHRARAVPCQLGVDHRVRNPYEQARRQGGKHAKHVERDLISAK